LSFSLNILFHLIIKLFVKVSILCKISKIVCSCIQYPFLYRFIPLYQLIWQMGKKDVVSIRTLHLKNYLNLRESRLCPKLCVNLSLRKCTSLSAGAVKPPSAPPCGVLPELFIRQESPYISFVSFFYTLCWM